MLKKTIKYTDYDGNEREEDFYFNLTKAELYELQTSVSGGLENTIRAMVAARDIPTMAKLFKEIVMKSYGEKSEDGKRFIKENGKRAEAFVETEAYNQLYVSLIEDENEMAEFINGIIPQIK